MTGDDWVPLTDPDEVIALDRQELHEGYADGLKNDPRPGPNRSAAYRHGWWNGMRDGGHRGPHPADLRLARNMRVAKKGVFDPDLFKGEVDDR